MIKSTPLVKLRCKSIFADLIKQYVNEKRTQGYKFNAPTECLNIFDDFIFENKISTINISKKVYDKWESKNYFENKSTHQSHIYAVRNFLKYLYKNGYKVPHNFHPAPKRNLDFIPYIFSHEELKCLFNVINNELPKLSATPIRHIVLPVLFNLLYTTGLRITEATMIEKEDVDIAKGTILIKNAKGNVDRIISLSSSMHKTIKNYLNKSEISNFSSKYLFPAPDHGYYDSSTIYDIFRQLLFKANIHHYGRGKGPRLHDLRHTFAVHVIDKWIEEKKDIYVCLPILSKYLGHKNITATERYIHLVPEAYKTMISSCTAKFPNLYSGGEYEK